MKTYELDDIKLPDHCTSARGSAKLTATSLPTPVISTLATLAAVEKSKPSPVILMRCGFPGSTCTVNGVISPVHEVQFGRIPHERPVVIYRHGIHPGHRFLSPTRVLIPSWCLAHLWRRLPRARAALRVIA